MTLDERNALTMKSIMLDREGKHEEALRVGKQVPLAPHLARAAKEMMGVDYLRQSGWNLSDAEAEYGKDWLK
jgi:hypothetical protein